MMTTPSDLPAVAALAGDGEPLWGLGGLWIIKVSAAQTGGSFSLIEVRMRRGTGTPLHRHDLDEERHEAFYRECCVPATSFEQPPDAGQIDLGIIVPAGRKHGVEIIAPPPAY
jgi:hypothetical protein